MPANSLPQTAEEVRAILDGTRTSLTVRMKHQLFPSGSVSMPWQYTDSKGVTHVVNPWQSPSFVRSEGPFKVGDRVYVKERVVQIGHERTLGGCYVWPRFDAPEDARRWFDGRCFYAAGLRHDDPLWEEPHGTLRAASMPAWAARLWLEITDVKAERDDAGVWQWVCQFKRATQSNV